MCGSTARYVARYAHSSIAAREDDVGRTKSGFINDGGFSFILHETQITCLRSKPKLKPRQRLPKPCICASPGLAPCPVSLCQLPALMCICVCVCMLADHSTVQSPRSLLLLAPRTLPQRPPTPKSVAPYLCGSVRRLNLSPGTIEWYGSRTLQHCGIAGSR